MNTTPKPRRPGRRSAEDSEALREALLKAARELFATHGFAAVSLRRIAEKAGANAAMIHYYFGDKNGLYEAMLETTIGPALKRLQVLDRDSVGGLDIATVMRTQTGILANNPWLPRLILQEVIAGNSQLRERFVQRFASRGAELLTSLVARGQAEGRFREDLDPRLAAMSAMSMVIFPFLTLPVASELFDASTDAAWLDRFVAHTATLFTAGLTHPIREE